MLHYRKPSLDIGNTMVYLHLENTNTLLGSSEAYIANAVISLSICISSCYRSSLSHTSLSKTLYDRQARYAQKLACPLQSPSQYPQWQALANIPKCTFLGANLLGSEFANLCGLKIIDVQAQHIAKGQATSSANSLLDLRRDCLIDVSYKPGH